MTNPPSEFEHHASHVPVPLPDLGAGSRPLRVSAWFVEPDDLVESGDALVEVLFSGITCDVCSPVAGRIVRLAKDIDAEVRPGDVVVWIATRETVC